MLPCCNMANVIEALINFKTLWEVVFVLQTMLASFNKMEGVYTINNR